MLWAAGHAGRVVYFDGALVCRTLLCRLRRATCVLHAPALQDEDEDDTDEELEGALDGLDGGSEEGDDEDDDEMQVWAGPAAAAAEPTGLLGRTACCLGS
jgi:hypothetical protein